MVRSSLLLTIRSCCGANITHDTLFMWPRSESTSQALLSARRRRRGSLAGVRAGSTRCRSQEPGRILLKKNLGQRGAEGRREENTGRERRTVHAPELDHAVVGARHDERQARVEGGPVDAALVALEDVLDDGVATAKEVRVHRALHAHQFMARCEPRVEQCTHACTSLFSPRISPPRAALGTLRHGRGQADAGEEERKSRM